MLSNKKLMCNRTFLDNINQVQNICLAAHTSGIYNKWHPRWRWTYYPSAITTLIIIHCIKTGGVAERVDKFSQRQNGTKSTRAGNVLLDKQFEPETHKRITLRP